MADERVKAGRTRESFDSGWSFLRGDINVPDTVKAGVLGGLADVVKRKKGKHLIVAFVDREMRHAADPARWPKVDLPHDFCVEGKITFSRDRNDTSHGFRPRGIGFYRKVFALPERDRGKRIVLEFDGIFRNSTVWVNGHRMIDHHSGYTSFHLDITDQVRYGAEGENCVLVRADARGVEGWWYEGGGIYRHVWLTKVSPVHVARWGTFLTTPVADKRRAKVRVETTVLNETALPRKIAVESVIIDPKGRAVAKASSSHFVAADGRVVVSHSMGVSRPRLWSPETPARYRLISRIKTGGKETDRYLTTFGIRSIRWTTKGFYLNGKLTPLKGTCNHQDFAGVGVALPDSIHEYKIRLLKGMGSNAYRCAHHPPAPEILSACDRLGMLVMDENRKLDSSENGLRDLESMILRDRNHPCVVVWSMENEEPLEGTPMGARILDRLARFTRKLDPTRPTTAAQNHGHVEGGYSQKVDISGFNYGTNGDKDVAYRKTHPDRRIVGTETNSTVTTRGAYEDDAKRCFVNSYGTTMMGWNAGFEAAWKSYLKHPFLTGIFVWTGFDYRGEPSPYGWPCVNSHFGLMDTCGFPKDDYHYYKAMFSSDPHLWLMPHWTWPGRKGKPVKVWALTNVEKAELFLNGRSLGMKRVEYGERLEWEVEYEPGELRAVGYRGGKPVVKARAETAGSPAKLELEPDRKSFSADSRDAVPVRVRVLDAKGQVVPSAGNLVKFSVRGPAAIIGVGNGNPASHEADKADRRRAFNGLALAIIQSDGRRGTVVLKASARGLKPATAALKARGKSRG